MIQSIYKSKDLSVSDAVQTVENTTSYTGLVLHKDMIESISKKTDTSLQREENQEQAQKSSPQETKVIFTPRQIEYLKDQYAKNKYPSLSETDDIASFMNLHNTKCRDWFNRQRFKDKLKTTTNPGNMKVNQKKYLLKCFSNNRFPNPDEIKKMAKYLKLDKNRINRWFTKHRCQEGKTNGENTVESQPMKDMTRIKRKYTGQSQVKNEIKKEAVSGMKSEVKKEIPDCVYVNEFQRNCLEKYFNKSKFPRFKEVCDIAVDVGLKTEQIKKWFYTRRHTVKHTPDYIPSNFRFSYEQRQFLESQFEKNCQPSSVEIESIATNLAVKNTTIQKWFSRQRRQLGIPMRVIMNKFTAKETDYLRHYFKTNRYPDSKDVHNLANHLNASIPKVQKWFSQERHYLKTKTRFYKDDGEKAGGRGCENDSDGLVASPVESGTLTPVNVTEQNLFHMEQDTLTESNDDDNFQSTYLERFFNKSKFPSSEEVEDIAVDVGMDKELVKAWFLSRRRKTGSRGLQTFSEEDTGYLNGWFEKSRFPEVESLREMAQHLQVDQQRVRKWFLNKKYKCKTTRNTLVRHLKTGTACPNLNGEQRKYLQGQFESITKYPDDGQCKEIAEHLDIDLKTVRGWFEYTRKLQVLCEKQKGCFTPEQRMYMRDKFHANKYPSTEQFDSICHDLNLQLKQVKKWFNHERERFNKKIGFYRNYAKQTKELVLNQETCKPSGGYLKSEHALFLKRHFARNQYPSPSEVDSFATHLAMKTSKIIAWFKYQRSRARHANNLKDKERPLENVSNNVKSLPKVRGNTKKLACNNNLTAEGYIFLKETFKTIRYPSIKQCYAIANTLNVHKRKVQNWFGHQRYNLKNKLYSYKDGAKVLKDKSAKDKPFLSSKRRGGLSMTQYSYLVIQNPHGHSAADYKKMSEHLNLNVRKIQKWFSRRRCKARKRLPTFSSNANISKTEVCQSITQGVKCKFSSEIDNLIKIEFPQKPQDITVKSKYFSKEQTDVLYSFFLEDSYPTPMATTRISKKLSCPYEKVQLWFKVQRRKTKQFGLVQKQIKPDPQSHSQRYTPGDCLKDLTPPPPFGDSPSVRPLSEIQRAPHTAYPGLLLHCPHCSFSVSSNLHFDLHLATHATNTSRLTPLPPDPLCPRCEICGYIAMGDDDFEEHVLRHMEEQMIVCAYCPRDFSSVAAASAHCDQSHPTEMFCYRDRGEMCKQTREEVKMSVLMHPTVCMDMIKIDRHGKDRERGTRDVHRDRHTIDEEGNVKKAHSDEQIEEEIENFRGIIKKEQVEAQILHLKEEDPESEHHMNL